MARQHITKTNPASPMNAWVRDAIDAAGLSYQRVGDEMTQRGLGVYDRSKVQKMTVARGVSAEEAAAIAQITGKPLPFASPVDAFADGYAKLSQQDRAVIDAMMQRLLAGQSSQE